MAGDEVVEETRFIGGMGPEKGDEEEWKVGSCCLISWD